MYNNPQNDRENNFPEENDNSTTDIASENLTLTQSSIRDKSETETADKSLNESDCNRNVHETKNSRLSASISERPIDTYNNQIMIVSLNILS